MLLKRTMSGAKRFSYKRTFQDGGSVNFSSDPNPSPIATTMGVICRLKVGVPKEQSLLQRSGSQSVGRAL